MLSRLIEIVQSFDQHRVLLIGDLILDCYVYGDAERISPEAPVQVLRQRSSEYRVGGAGSVAANMRSLGIDVICCGAVADDNSGHRVRALLEEQNVSTQAIITVNDRPTTTKTRFVGLAQHRHQQQLIRVDQEVTAPINGQQFEQLKKLIAQAINEVDIVCLEDYEKGLLTTELCQEVIAQATAAGKPVFVDPARINNYSRYRGATMLTPNRTEFSLAAGLTDDSTETITAHANDLLEQYNLGGVLITLDKEGSLLALRGEKPVAVPTRPRAVYDVTGAGDAVLAMLSAAVASGASWEEAARLTNTAGGLEVEKFGCIPVTKDEVIADLRLSAGAMVNKLRTLDELRTEIQLRRQRKETIVFTNGCYDLLHVGHVRFFDHCRAAGDVVIVGLNSDASVRDQNKGTDRPIIPENERAEVLAALHTVDYVVIFDDPTPLKMIEALNPHVLVKGEDWKDKGVVGREHVEANGGRVDLVPLVPGSSTTSIVEKIRNAKA